MSVIRKVDYHCHTYHSPCAQPEMVPEAIFKAAEERGIQVLGLTDHWYRHLLHRNNFAVLREECAGKQGRIRLLFGCEAEVTSPTGVSITEEEAAQFDYILLAATHFQCVGIVESPPSTDPEAVAKHFLAMFRRGAATPYADIIPHPFFVVPNTYDPLAPSLLTDAELLEAIEVAKQNNVAVEISRRALTPGQAPFFLRFYKLCKRVGLKFSVGGDSHELINLGSTAAIEPIVRELDLRVEDLWTPKNMGPL